MKLTLVNITGFHLRDEQGRHWTTIETNGAGWPCSECGAQVWRGYSRRTSKTERAYVCPACIELVIPDSLVKAAQS